MTASTWRSQPVPTACISGRTTWPPTMRAPCSGQTRSSACRSRPSTRPRTAPVELFDYAGVGGVYATLSKEQKTCADWHRRVHARGGRIAWPCARIYRSSALPASTLVMPLPLSLPAPTALPSSRRCRSRPIPRAARSCVRSSTRCWGSGAREAAPVSRLCAGGA